MKRICRYAEEAGISYYDAYIELVDMGEIRENVHNERACRNLDRRKAAIRY